MAFHRQHSWKILVSNIPNNLDHEDLLPILSEVGVVKNFDLIYGTQTTESGRAKHKGYGFCEYYDEASRDAAIRNLSSRPVDGVYLRIKAADGGKLQAVRDEENEQRQAPRMELEASTPICQALSQLTLSEVYEAMEQMRQLVLTDEPRATKILDENPQLGMAMLHIFHYMGITRKDPAEEQRLSAQRKEWKRRQREEGIRVVSDRKRPRVERPSPTPRRSTTPPPAPPAPSVVAPPPVPTMPVLSPPSSSAAPPPPAPSPPPPSAEHLKKLEGELEAMGPEGIAEIMSFKQSGAMRKEDWDELCVIQDIIRRNPEKYGRFP